MADLLDARCVVCVGQGGVGKTSSSAALAIDAALRGRRTVVLTIDPAKRLANALGLPEIGSVETEIPRDAFQRHGLEAPAASLSALMLDIKEAWDDVISRYHPDPEQRKRLLNHRMYQALSTALAGSQEYMAMEKLYQLSKRVDDPLDCIVLDTPPANHAVDFMDAPQRILDALSNDATRWLLEPLSGSGRHLGRRIWDAGASFFVRTVSRLTGTEMLQQLAELLEGFQGMMGGFRQRAEAVQALLSARDTGFVVVGHPSPDGLEEARAFVERLRTRKARILGIVLNRGHVDRPFSSLDVASLREALADSGGAEAAEALAEHARRENEAAAREAEAARALSQQTGIPVWRVPELDEDVHDLHGLDALRRELRERHPV